MAISIRSKREVDKLRAAGKVVGEILQHLTKIIEPGITTARLAQVCDEMISEAGGTALFKGVPNPPADDFPASICTSINEQVVHGIPSDKVILSEGDIISIDCGVKLHGYCGDAAVTVPVGRVDETKQRLMRITEEVLQIAVAESRPGRKWSEVAALMQQHAENAGFGVVREYVGHGIGRHMHEDPKVPNFVSRELKAHDILLRKGMIIAVEPMINMGTYRTKVLDDGWTVVTADGKPSAHFEHTLAITENGTEVLTLAD